MKLKVLIVAILLMVACVVVPVVGALPINFTSKNISAVVAGYIDPIDGGTPNLWTGTTNNGRTYLNINDFTRARQNITVTTVRTTCYNTTYISNYSVQIWRYSTDWQLISSENIISKLSNGVMSTVDLNTTMQVQEGDYVGVYINGTVPKVTSLLGVNTFVANSTKYVESPVNSGHSWTTDSGIVSIIPIQLIGYSPSFVLIGDSIIAGHPSHYSGIENATVWDSTNQIGRHLAGYIGNNISYQNMGIGSQTSTKISSRFERDATNLSPNFVIISGGVNDLAAIGTNPEITWLENIGSMTNRSLANGTTPIILQIAPWSNGNNTQMQWRDQWNLDEKILITNISGAYIVNVDSYVGSYRTGGDAGNLWNINSSYSAGDGIHFNNVGYSKIALAIFDKINEINSAPITATFTPTGPISLTYPNGVAFTDTSTGGPTAWNWSYKHNGIGSGTSFNTSRNATFFPPSIGNYTIHLNASTIAAYNISTQTTWVNVSSGVDFARNQTIGYQYPMPVAFTDLTNGTTPTNWSWQFGDTYTSTNQNPSHIYTVAGNYTTNLTIYNSTGSFFSSTEKYVQLNTDDDTFLRSWHQFENATIVDLKGVAWTNSGASLSPIHKFGVGSLYVPTGNNYISSPSSSIWDRSSIAGELEFWINVTSYGDAGKEFIRRSAGTSGHANGWGFFNINGTRYGNAFWYGNGAVNYTTPFDIPLNTWTHVVLVRGTDQYWRTYVNGVLWGSPVYMDALMVDTANPFMIGSSGPGTEPSFRVDEFRYSQGVPRFVSDFSTPYDQYKGNLFVSYININPNATLRFKSNPTSIVYNYNQTGARNRTVQIQNITNASSLYIAGTYDPLHIIPQAPIVNNTNYSDLVIDSYGVDRTNGIVWLSISRTGGGISALFDNRTNLFDVGALYYNYTNEELFNTYFGYSNITDGEHGVTYPIYNYIATPVRYGDWPNPVTDFAANTTTPALYSTVQFTDTSTNYPTAWSWDFGDMTGSTLQNPTHSYTSLGTYTVSLTSYQYANATITNSTTKVGYITVISSSGAPVASFTGNPTVVGVSSPVTFTDSSTGTPTSWSWNFGDSSTSTLQNPSHAYSGLGLYTVNLTVSNVNGTSTLSRPAYINVTATPPVTNYTEIVDLTLTPLYALTITVTDSATGLPIPNATVVDTINDVTKFTDATGVVTLDESYGVAAGALYATGYVARSWSTVIDSDTAETLQMVPVSETGQNSNIIYTPHQVKFYVVDAYGNPQNGANITVNYVSSSLPSTDTNWLISAYGIDANVAADMVNDSVAMTAVTQDDGSNTFTMFGSLTYLFSISNTTSGLSCTKRVAPIDTSYRLYCPLSTQHAVNNTLTQAATSSLPYYRINNTYGYNLSMIYYDAGGYTTALTFNVWDYTHSNTLVYSKSWSGFGTTQIVDNYTVYVPLGQEYRWQYNATKV